MGLNGKYYASILHKLLLILLLLSYCGLNNIVCAKVTTDINILVLLSFHTTLPWSKAYLGGLEKAKDKYSERINYYIEVMDSIRLGDSMSDSEWVRYLRSKYHNVEFDAAIAESAKASLFLNQYGKSIIGPKTIVFYTGTETESLPQTKTLKLQEDKAVVGTLRLALDQNPSRNEIVIIDGSDIDSRNVLKVLMRQIEKLSNKKVTHIKNFTIEELIETVSKLSSDSIIFYNLVFSDRTGRKFIPKNVLTNIATVSRAPIYSFWSSLMGSGAVGGHMIDGNETAIKTIEAVMDYHKSQRFKDEYDTLQTVIDWRAMERYEIDPDTIPNNANVINRPITLFEQYSREIRNLSIFIVIVVILALLWMNKLTELNKKLTIEKSRAENLARIDALTGLHNRRAFFEMCVQACNEAKRLRLPISIMLLDIDYFKKINDTFGHLAGDKVLKQLADIITKSKRGIDIAARFGGEEFILLLPFSDANGSRNLAERIRTQCENTTIDYAGRDISITISVGIFCDLEPTNPCTINEAIQYADNALYMAKRSGRNQTTIYPNSFTYKPLLT